MVTVIVPTRYDQLINADGTPTTLFSVYLESLTANNTFYDMVEPYYRSMSLITKLRAELEDSQIINHINLIPVNDDLKNQINDLTEQLLGLTLGFINTIDLNGFLKNIIEDTTPQLGGNLDTQTFTVDGRNVSVDGIKLDGIEVGATADQTNAEIKIAYEANVNTNAFTDANISTLGSALQNIIEDGTPQLGGQLDALNNKIINLGSPTLNNDVTNKLYVDGQDALKLSLTGGVMTGILSNTNIADSTSTSTGSIHTNGGMGIVRSLNVGGQVGIGIGANSGYPLTLASGLGGTFRISNGGEFGFINLEPSGELKLWAHGDLSTDLVGLYSGSGSGIQVASFNRLSIILKAPTVVTSTLSVNNTASTINSGLGSPEGSMVAPPGSIYMRTTGGASTSFYVKESGTSNVGWVAK